MALNIFVACACSVVTGDGIAGTARQFVFAAYTAIVTHVMHGIHVTTAWFVFVLLVSPLLHVLLLIPHLLG